MSSELQQQYSRQGVPDAWSTFVAQLAHFAVVDVGRIEAIDYEKSIATVQTYYVKGADAKKVEAEIVMIGNLSGYLSTIDVGQSCILFYPRSPSASLKEELIDKTYGLYNERAVKCLPVTTYNASQLVTISHATDTLAVSTLAYNLNLNPESLSFVADKFQVLWDMTEGVFGVGWGAAGEGYSELQSDGSREVSTGRVFDSVNDVTNWKTRVVQNNDGSISVEGAGEVNDSKESFGQNSAVFNNDGSIDIKTGITKDGKQATHIQLSADGKVKIAVFDGDEEKASIALDKAGTVDITTADAYSISGKGVSIDGTDGKVSIKNGQASLYADVLKAMLQILNTSLATQGSPAAHTVVPNQFQTVAQKLDALME